MAEKKANKSIDAVKKAAEDTFYYFLCLVNPSYDYGDIHKEVADWFSNPSLDQLLLLPRGHLKSHLIATWCAWWITKHPEVTILYVSATDDLALQQLYAIKGILTSDVYQRYWPEMVHPEEAKREEWNVRNIKVDHPRRKVLGVRDRTVAARSVGGNTTGLHADVIVFDDLVVPDNAYTEAGRATVAQAYAQFSSVANTGCITKVVGTRYHGKDIYSTMLSAEVEQFDDIGQVIGTIKLYDVMERKVEIEGDFLWPRSLNTRTNKWYGFDIMELAKIRAKYFAAQQRAQYYAQYYNDPNDPDSDALKDSDFAYYEIKHLKYRDGIWSIHGKPLAIFAAGDLAYTINASSDFTAFAVVGLDCDGFIYILELDQVQTDKYDVMYKMARRLHDKWGFRKIRMETNAGANLVVEYMKTEARRDGRALIIEGARAMGEKTERCNMILLPKYSAHTVLHYKGGLTNLYEEQITLQRPPHDDLRDAVAAAVEISRPPSKRLGRMVNDPSKVIGINERFGGRVR